VPTSTYKCKTKEHGKEQRQSSLTLLLAYLINQTLKTINHVLILINHFDKRKRLGIFSNSLVKNYLTAMINHDSDLITLLFSDADWKGRDLANCRLWPKGGVLIKSNKVIKIWRK